MTKKSYLPYTAQDLLPTINNSGSNSETVTTKGSLPRLGTMLGTSSRSGSMSGVSNVSESFGASTAFTPSPNIWNVSSTQNLRVMFKRIIKPKTLDFETAMWEIFHLIINPRKMYRSQYYYKQYQSNKNSYARDDPSFLILLTTFLIVSAIAWGLAYSPHFLDILKLILYMVFIDFYLTGFIISTISWLLTNRLLNKSWGINRFNVYYIGWGFCFDVHCNSFLIVWCILYLLQYILLPLITVKDSFLSLLVGNSLYFISAAQYFVITFYGFNSLPVSNDNPNKILQLIIVGGILPVIGLLWIISLALRINVAYYMIDIYFN